MVGKQKPCPTRDKANAVVTRRAESQLHRFNADVSINSIPFRSPPLFRYRDCANLTRGTDHLLPFGQNWKKKKWRGPGLDYSKIRNTTRSSLALQIIPATTQDSSSHHFPGHTLRVLAVILTSRGFARGEDDDE